ncbi:MAG: large conductance mechanosensitive channel protein MscL [Candidatus Gastranaerophilales bacterium]|nr:large conductance mechanosensitive channel protein MscL [Candidatus Gastranaerophilales bacterium]
MFKLIKKELNDFKAFAVKGNVIDMAVGIIIGASFSGVVSSLVNDVIMPPLGWLLGKVDFTNLYITMPNPASLSEIHSYPSLEAAKAAGAVTINYGLFINQIISFVIVAFSVFLLVKCITKLQAAAKKEEQAQVEITTKSCPRCTSEIPINATKCPKCTADI